MTIDYVAMMQKSESGGGDHAAAKTASVISYESVKPKRLTKKKNSAQMQKRTTAEKTSMAKGKKKTKAQKEKAQKARFKKLKLYKQYLAQGMSKSEAAAKAGTRKGAKGSKKPKKAKSETKTDSAAPRKVPKKPKGSKNHGKKSGSKRAKGRTQSVRTTTSRGSTTINVRVPTPVAKRSRSKPRKTKAKSKAKGKSKSKKGGSKKGASRSKKGAMENPMTGVELFVGTFTGLLGFGTADVVDRIIATHALTASTSGSSTTYTDTPPTASPAQGTKATYGSLFNATAVCAPMNLPRWAAGLAISGVPIIIAHWVSAPVGRSALQFFGFGAGMRIVGKGMIDLLALITKSNATGMRLYGGEQRAQAIVTNDGSTSKLPSQATTGLGRSALAAAPAGHKTGCGCQACGNTAPALAAAPQRVGAGWPSYPATAPAPAVQAPPAQAAPPAPALNVGIQGAPKGLGAVVHYGFQPRLGMYDWGNKVA